MRGKGRLSQQLLPAAANTTGSEARESTQYKAPANRIDCLRKLADGRFDGGQASFEFGQAVLLGCHDFGRR